jgi:hypothetical protein
MEHYGVESCFQDPTVYQKCRQSMLERHGVEFSAQNESIWERQQVAAHRYVRFRDTSLFYQGTYERDFLDCYYDRIVIEKPKKRVRYQFGGKTRIYHPDFYLPDHHLIVEIKSTYTFNRHLDKNLAKQAAAIAAGYRFVFVIDKDYTEVDRLLAVKSST